MISRLPARPNLEFLRKQAKKLKQDAIEQNSLALERFNCIFGKILKEPKLSDAQFILAREFGFSSWAKLKEKILTDSPIQKALEDLVAGKGCILFDDEGRENEGDFVFSGEKLLPEHLNLMTKYGRGTICVSLSDQLAQSIGLSKQSDRVEDLDSPPFAQSIDHASTSTGVSVIDRHLTVTKLLEEGAKIGNFRTPGHMHTLVARKGGFLERKGHTEGSVELMKMAGLREAAVICEIMKDDGSMARYDDLKVIAKKCGMQLISSSDLLH